MRVISSVFEENCDRLLTLERALFGSILAPAVSVRVA